MLMAVILSRVGQSFLHTINIQEQVILNPVYERVVDLMINTIWLICSH